MNTLLLETSRWLWDYYLLATVLLVMVLALGKLIAQPARRMAVHWSAAAGLLLLSLLCAVPGWSLVNLLTAPALPQKMSEVELFGPAVRVIDDLPSGLQVTPQRSENAPTTSDPMPEMAPVLVLDYSLLLPYAVTAGSTVALLWLTLGMWQVRRLRAQAKPAPAMWADIFTTLTDDSSAVQLGVVSRLPVAAAVGLRRPMVLLPETFLQCTELKQMRTVLAHELAHIRHRDLWLLAVLRAMLLVLWAHPLYWWWRHGVRLDQETLADAAAAEVTNRTNYAEQLVGWAREHASTGRRLPLASSVGLWESRSQLKRRVAILLDEKLVVLRDCSRGWRVGLAVSLLSIAAGLSLITLSPAEPPAASSELVESIPQAVEPRAEESQIEYSPATLNPTHPIRPPDFSLQMDASPSVILDQEALKATRADSGFRLTLAPGEKIYPPPKLLYLGWQNAKENLSVPPTDTVLWNMEGNQLSLAEVNAIREKVGPLWCYHPSESGVTPLLLVFAVREEIEQYVMPTIITEDNQRLTVATARSTVRNGMNLAVVQPRQDQLNEWPNRIDLLIRYPNETAKVIRTLYQVPVDGDPPERIADGVTWRVDRKRAKWRDPDTGRLYDEPLKTAGVLQSRIDQENSLTEYTVRIHLQGDKKPVREAFATVIQLDGKKHSLRVSEAFDRWEVERIDFFRQRFGILPLRKLLIRTDLLPATNNVPAAAGKDSNRYPSR